MRKMKKETLVVALLLPIFIFLLSVSVSHAFVNGQIQASVTVNPKPTIYCDPTTLTAGSSVQWIYCFTELEGADVHDINPANVQLTIVGKLGSVPADPFFKQFGDFNSNGQTEIMLRFSRSSADTAWFNSLTQTTPLTFNLIGSVNNFPYSGTSPILVITKATACSFARYFQLDAPDIGDAKLNWVYGPDWFNYKNYTPTYLHFSGYFYNLGNRLSGSSAFYSEGYLKVEKIYNYILFQRKVIENQSVKISVVTTSYIDCSCNPAASETQCEGTALLTITKTGSQYSTYLSNLMFDVSNGKAMVEGGNIFNELFKASDITISKIYFS